MDKAAIHFFSDQALNNSQGTKSTWISLFLWIQLKINDAINAIDTKEWSNRAEKKQMRYIITLEARIQ